MEERDWGSVRGKAILICRLNEPSDAFDTPSDLLWSLAEWHHSGEERGVGVGVGRGKKNHPSNHWWISNPLQLSIERGKLWETTEESCMLAEGRAQPSMSDQGGVNIWGFGTVVKRTSAGLWSCPGTSPYYYNTSQVLFVLGTAQSPTSWAGTSLFFFIFKSLVNGRKFVIFFLDWTVVFTRLMVFPVKLGDLLIVALRSARSWVPREQLQ